jgi:hypothetical protein
MIFDRIGDEPGRVLDIISGEASPFDIPSD